MSTLLRLLRRLEPPGRVTLAARWVRGLVVLRGCSVGPGCGVSGPVRIEGRRGVHLGARVRFLGGMVPTALIARPGATLRIGDDTAFNYGVTLSATGSVDIGARCLFGSFVRVSDEHGGQVAPVRIGDDVWVAHGAVIHPGVTVGDGAVVGAGAVVTRDVPPRTMALGNPARVMSLDLAQAPQAHGGPS